MCEEPDKVFSTSILVGNSVASWKMQDPDSSLLFNEGYPVRDSKDLRLQDILECIDRVYKADTKKASLFSQQPYLIH